jgi:hypothetical protein
MSSNIADLIGGWSVLSIHKIEKQVWFLSPIFKKSLLSTKIGYLILNQKLFIENFNQAVIKYIYIHFRILYFDTI